MNAKIIAVSALLLTCAALSVLGDDGPAADQPLTRVVKFVGTHNGTAGGRPTMMLRAASKYGVGGAIQIAVPNTDPAAKKIDPDPALARVIGAAKPGDFLKVTYARQKGRFVLSQVEPYTPQPAEIDPEAWEFIKSTETTVAGQTVQAVVLSQLDKEQTLLVPGEKNDEGVLVPDAKVLAQIAKLTAGDFADLLTTRSGKDTYLRCIFPYQEPQAAAFTRVATAETEAGPVETTVTLTKDDQTIVLTVPPGRPGGPADPAIMSKVRPLRPNMAVLYKSAEDDGKLCLIDIKTDAQQRKSSGGGDGGGGVMTGTFVWNGKAGQTNPLKAVLTRTGAGQYTAVYTFTWSGTPKTYVGTVTGNLRNGEVSGTGDGDRRKFTFTGTAKNGLITFKAFEVTGGRTLPQGHGTLGRS